MKQPVSRTYLLLSVSTENILKGYPFAPMKMIDYLFLYLHLILELNNLQYAISYIFSFLFFSKKSTNINLTAIIPSSCS